MITNETKNVDLAASVLQGNIAELTALYAMGAPQDERRRAWVHVNQAIGMLVRNVENKINAK